MQTQHPMRTVTASVDGEVLSVLARADTTFTVSQISARTRRSIEGVRRSLARLVEQGTVTKEQVGPLASYQLNRAHLAAPSIIALAGLDEVLVTRLREVVREWERPPVFAALFGSAARRLMQPASDIDLIFVTNDDAHPLWQAQIMKLARDAQAWTGNVVHPVVYDEDELRGRGDEPLVRDVAEDGIVIAGERSQFRKLVAA